MLSKCVNPLCYQPFLHLESGRLFRLDHTATPAFRPSEYFWLCHRCTGTLTLRLDQQNRVKVMRLHETLPEGSHSGGLVVIDRRHGLVLNGISFTSDSARKGTTRSEGVSMQMTDDVLDDNELLAAGTNCPFPDCHALVVTYRPADEAKILGDLWIFTCPRCGLEFARPHEDLLFQSIQKAWLLADIHSA